MVIVGTHCRQTGMFSVGTFWLHFHCHFCATNSCNSLSNLFIQSENRQLDGYHYYLLFPLICHNVYISVLLQKLTNSNSKVFLQYSLSCTVTVIISAKHATISVPKIPHVVILGEKVQESNICT